MVEAGDRRVLHAGGAKGRFGGIGRNQESTNAMAYRQATLDFVVKCQSAQTVGDIAGLLFSEMASCGIAHVACASHVDPLHPPPGAVAMVNYPDVWLKRFSEMQYAKRDPVFWGARFLSTPFRWKDLIEQRQLASDQRNILNEARECGIADGLTIPIHTPGALPASCSLVPGADGVDPLLVPDIQFMAIHAHEEARLRAAKKSNTPVVLSRRELEYLTLAATGKSDWAIAQLVGRSPRTVHHILENAKKKYGVSHRIQAVMRAILDGSIVVDQEALSLPAEGAPSKRDPR